MDNSGSEGLQSHRQAREKHQLTPVIRSRTCLRQELRPVICQVHYRQTIDVSLIGVACNPSAHMQCSAVQCASALIGHKQIFVAQFTR